MGARVIQECRAPDAQLVDWSRVNVWWSTAFPAGASRAQRRAGRRRMRTSR
ncbi:hypothetical protein QJS66_02915 [Kocuria rhizophila]|nr:hypothetical protein QJS66_02915 [Kocuria rhizophila]